VSKPVFNVTGETIPDATKSIFAAWGDVTGIVLSSNGLEVSFAGQRQALVFAPIRTIDRGQS
jgi:hypothetical protein